MDLQAVRPLLWCPWCGQEIYPGEVVWRVDGNRLHEECVEGYVKKMWPHEVMGQVS